MFSRWAIQRGKYLRRRYLEQPFYSMLQPCLRSTGAYSVNTMNPSCSYNTSRFARFDVTDINNVRGQSFGLSLAVIGCWVLRFIHDRTRAYKDARAILVTLCILNRAALLCQIRDLASRWHVHTSHIAWSSALALVSWCVWQMPRGVHSTPALENKHKDMMFLKPCVFPCRTTHSRLFPEKHSFSYSYLYVGIPVGWKGQAGNILSADSDPDGSITSKTWFSVLAADYLQRGVHENGLQGKLQDYLLSQGISPAVYTHAYLVTAPRFLGFSFNPVSFWYLYDSTPSLAAMILEVNNTFDERRMYLMERKATPNEVLGPAVKFAQEWPKDFHVSPFNDRGGAYSVQSTDPFNSSINGLHKIDNNIVLTSTDGKPKLVARVFSTESGIDARTINTWNAFHFVLRWWWVGFMTNPRILKEARTLWAKKLQVYYRPEVLSSSIGRKETADEINLEVFFRHLLFQLAAATHCTFHYTAAAGPSRGKQTLIRSTRAYDKNKPQPEIDIQILTPAFYSQLVRHETLLDSFNRYCFQAATGEAMVICTHSEILQDALPKFSASLQTHTGSNVDWHIVANYAPHQILRPLWQMMIVFLRCCNVSGYRLQHSDFDICVLRSSSQISIGAYYKITLKLLLADCIALGWMPILKLQEACVWSLLVLAAASASGSLLGLTCQAHHHLTTTLLKLYGVHFWSVLV